MHIYQELDGWGDTCSVKTSAELWPVIAACKRRPAEDPLAEAGTQAVVYTGRIVDRIAQDVGRIAQAVGRIAQAVGRIAQIVGRIAQIVGYTVPALDHADQALADQALAGIEIGAAVRIEVLVGSERTVRMGSTNVRLSASTSKF